MLSTAMSEYASVLFKLLFFSSRLSESDSRGNDFVDFFLDDIDFADKATDCIVDVVVGCHDLLEGLQVHVGRSTRIIVLSLDELLLRHQRGKLLLQMSILLLFGLLNLAMCDTLFIQIVNFSLLFLNFSSELQKKLVLLRNDLGVISKLNIETLQFLLEFHLITQQVIISFLLRAEFVLHVFILCLDHFIISQKLFDSCTFFSIESLLETFIGDFFLSFELGLQFFVLAVCQLFLFDKLFSFVVELFSHLCQQLHLNVQELDLNLCIENLLS